MQTKAGVAILPAAAWRVTGETKDQGQHFGNGPTRAFCMSSEKGAR
jgi:hypothetical protein